MAQQKRCLEINELTLVVAGKEFTLREWSGRRVTEYLDMQQKLAAEVTEKADNENVDIAEYMAAVYAKSEKLVAWILGESEAWVDENVPPRHRAEIIRAVDELNGLVLQGNAPTSPT